MKRSVLGKLYKVQWENKMRFGRLSIYIMTFIVGLGLFFGGIEFYISEKGREELSDDMIKERARELGMVELKESLQMNTSETSE